MHSTFKLRVTYRFVPFRTAVACVCAGQTVGDGTITPTRNGSNGPRARFQCCLALSKTLVPAAGLYAVSPRLTISSADFPVDYEAHGDGRVQSLLGFLLSIANPGHRFSDGVDSVTGLRF